MKEQVFYVQKDYICMLPKTNVFHLGGLKKGACTKVHALGSQNINKMLIQNMKINKHENK